MNDNPYSSPLNSDLAASAPVKPRVNERTGIGGWLILVGISLVISGIYKVVTLFQNINVMSSSSWQALTTPGTEVYDPMWGPGIVAETVMVAMMIGLNIWVFILYFGKKSRFPTMFIIFALANVGVAVIDYAICKSIHNFPKENFDGLTKAILQTGIYAGIWCTYMKKSMRVEQTFVR